MKTAKLGDIFEYDGNLFEVKGIANGKMLIVESLEEINICPNCSHKRKENRNILEESHNFQTKAKPIETIS